MVTPTEADVIRTSLNWLALTEMTETRRRAVRDDALTHLAALCDAYLAQRAENALFRVALKDITSDSLSGRTEAKQIARAALSAAPLAPETKNEGG